MRAFNNTWSRQAVAEYLKRKANQKTYNGDCSNPWNVAYIEQCKAAYEPDGVILIFSRDVGHHSSGWWKNPDYERCLHLSLSFRDRTTGKPIARDKKLSAIWVESFFEATRNLVWTEPPFGPEGKECDVWHYRVFYAEDWRAPILPRGEVYSKDWTPANWRSWSDQRAQDEKEVDTWLNQH